MDFIASLNIPRVAFCVVSVLFAVYFIRMYQLDEDKRKVMGAISFAFLACSSAFQIIPMPSFFYFVANFISVEAFPLVVTALLVLYFEIKHQKTLNSLKFFYLFLIVLLIAVFVPMDFSQISTSMDVLGLIALTISLYLFARNRQLSNVLISLAVTSFLSYGMGWTFNLGLPFIFLCYGFGFIFVAMAFSFLSSNDKSVTGSFFRVSKQIDEAHARLQELKIEYKTVFESVTDAIFIINSQSNQIIDCNLEATKLVERAREEIVGKDPSLLFVRGENAEEFSLSHEEQNQEFSTLIEKHVRTGRGDLRDVAIKLGSFTQGDQRLLVAVLRDVTVQNRNAAALSAALQSLSEKMNSIQVLNEKLSVIGSLTRHDVRNKLSAVNGYTYLLKKKHKDQVDIMDGLGKIEQAVVDSAKIFDFAKMYENLGVEKLSCIDVGGVVDEAVALFPGLAFKVVNDCHGKTVLADSFLRQMFYNFIDNTRKYGKNATTIRAYFEEDISGGLQLIYEDNGSGISAANKAKLFKEGFSTGGSTGFGLFLIKKMMDVYGWQIQEDGTPGEGAKFTITIPKLNKNGKENYQIAQSTIAKF